MGSWRWIRYVGLWSLKTPTNGLLVPLIMLSLNHENHKQWPNGVMFLTHNSPTVTPSQSHTPENPNSNWFYRSRPLTMLMKVIKRHQRWRSAARISTVNIRNWTDLRRQVSRITENNYSYVESYRKVDTLVLICYYLVYLGPDKLPSVPFQI